VASIISKKVNGQSYYYLRQMARVDGKPKMAWECGFRAIPYTRSDRIRTPIPTFSYTR
jgi:hypothetical protein